nr:4Fe-4S binding protein [uncultured Eubacterium sp.]
MDPKKCAGCGDCMENCPEDAIVKTSGKVPKLPKVGKFKR